MAKPIIDVVRWPAIVLVAGLAQITRAELPEQGLHIPELSAFDDAVQDVLGDNDLTAAVVGVMKEGCVVYQRGFGYRDVSVDPLPENATMRIASVSKALTARAIARLEQAGLLEYGDFAFDLGQPGGGILSIAPFGGAAAAGISDITVQHLLDHTAGWAGDYSWWDISVAGQTGVASPPGLDTTISWALAQDLATTPGDQYAYSNFGYNVLTRIVAEVSGTDFVSYLRQHVTTPAMWVPQTEIFGGLPFLDQRGPREPIYIAEDGWVSVPNVFDPDGPEVTWPYGGFDTVSTYGSSSLVTSVTPLLAFVHAYWPASSATSLGSMPGVNSAMMARSDDIGIVVLINQRIGSGAPYHAAEEIAIRISDIIDGGVTWPTQCIDGFWVDCVPPGGAGNFASPFGGLEDALDHTAAASRLQIRPGEYNWTGVIDRRLSLHAPLGTVRIGDLSGCE